MALTRTSIAQEIGNSNELTRNDAMRVVESIINIIKERLASGEDVLISNFGKFELREKNARRGRNPATGEDLELRARRIVVFKVSGKLRDRVNCRKK